MKSINAQRIVAMVEKSGNESVVINATDEKITLRDGRSVGKWEVASLVAEDAGTKEIVIDEKYIVCNHYNGNGAGYWILSSGGFPFCGGKQGLTECLQKAAVQIAEWQKEEEERQKAKAFRELAVAVFDIVKGLKDTPIIVHAEESIFICGPNSHNEVPGSYEVGGKYFKWWRSANFQSRHGRHEEVVRLLAKLPEEARTHLRFVAAGNAFMPEIAFRLELIKSRVWERQSEEVRWTERKPNTTERIGGQSIDEYAEQVRAEMKVWLGKHIELE